MNKIILIDSPEYQKWVFSATHPTQGRRFGKASYLFQKFALEQGIVYETDEPFYAVREQLIRVHHPDYVDEVFRGFSEEWDFERQDLGDIARLMAGGTIRAVRHLLDGKAKLAINFAGAKHHAQYAISSGFCVFNDLAIGALMATAEGKRVAIFDLDAHHGDGTENLLADDPNVLTFSVHEWGIFPGTGLTSDRDKKAYNFPLEAGAGDYELSSAVQKFLYYANEFKPDLIFIAGGADGLKSDPLANLEYSNDALVSSMKRIRQEFPDTPIFFGGAGGYLPDDETPLAWASMAIALSDKGDKRQ